MKNSQTTKHTLPNGLQIHLKEIHTSPLISQWVWYRVGSRNEAPGKTGVSHWVEHMQFKGSSKYPGDELDRLISRHGGMWNAMTYLDWTAYLETMPADKIDLAIDLEANRMEESLFDLNEVEAERTVIISEREGNENIPIFRLDEAVQKAAFKVHAYRNEVIGEKEDLLSMTREDLYQHYREYYSPANAIVCLAGDFDSQAMFEKVAEAYKGIAGRQTRPQAVTQEPWPIEFAHLDVPIPGDTTFIHVAYRAPQASHEDFFAFSVLDSLLAGPSPLNMVGGGGIGNKTSRFYKALVEQNFAVGVGASLQPTVDPYLYDIHVTLHPDKTPEQALEVLDSEIKRIQDTPVTAAEIARAAKQARAQFVYGSENITNQGFWLGYAEMFADYAWFENYVERVGEITPQDVQRIAQKYFDPTRRIEGFGLPKLNGSVAL